MQSVLFWINFPNFDIHLSRKPKRAPAYEFCCSPILHLVEVNLQSQGSTVGIVTG
jgi:hypothetical protein